MILAQCCRLHASTAAGPAWKSVTSNSTER